MRNIDCSCALGTLLILVGLACLKFAQLLARHLLYLPLLQWASQGASSQQWRGHAGEGKPRGTGAFPPLFGAHWLTSHWPKCTWLIPSQGGRRLPTYTTKGVGPAGMKSGLLLATASQGQIIYIYHHPRNRYNRRVDKNPWGDKDRASHWEMQEGLSMKDDV